MVRGSPCICTRHTAQPLWTAAASASGSCSARTSLMSPAPALAAARMICALLVSTEITALVRARSRSITGTTRRASSPASTAAAPGRVDSPPTSMNAAPSAAMRTPCSTAACVEKKFPPTENEKGVTLSTPITKGRDRSSVLSAQRSRTGGADMGGRQARPLVKESIFGDAVDPSMEAPAKTSLFLTAPKMLSFTRSRAAVGLVLPRGYHRSACDRPFSGRLGRFVGKRLIPVRRRLRRPACHDVLQLALVEGFVLYERVGHEVQLVERLHENLPRALVVRLDHMANFLIDRMRGHVGHLFVLRDAAAEEYFPGLFRIGQWPELVRQAPLGNHVARQIGGTFDVVGRTGGNRIRAEYQLLGDAAAEQGRDRALQAPLGVAVAVLLSEKLRDAQRAAARNDGDLVDRIVFRDGHADNGVARLVVGGHALLGLAHDHRAPFRAHHDLVLGALELVHADDAAIGARREQRRFVDEIGKICPGESGRAPRNQRRADILAERHAPHVHAQDLLAAAPVGQRHYHLAIEAPGTQQRRIEHVRPVGGGNDDDPFITLEAIHFHQQLVERLLALLVPAAKPRAAVASHGIDLVDENNARRVLLRLLEH